MFAPARSDRRYPTHATAILEQPVSLAYSR
jgi:hypothetical protein